MYIAYKSHIIEARMKKLKYKLVKLVKVKKHTLFCTSLEYHLRGPLDNETTRLVTSFYINLQFPRTNNFTMKRAPQVILIR